jgi:hypothetical protein
LYRSSFMIDTRSQRNDMKSLKLGAALPSESKASTWVQTERAAHDAWGDLAIRSPRAAALMHKLVANMGRDAAVVASHATLAEITGYSLSTLKRAIADLQRERWIEVIQIGGKGGACAYVVNDRVAWADARSNLTLSRFSASIVASSAEQTEVKTEPLRRIPVIMRGERQLPSGAGAEPPSQPALDGLEPDLPALVRDESGREWEVDQTTGELQGKLV